MTDDRYIDLLARVRDLEGRVRGIPLRVPAGGGEGGLTIETYTTFPDIPEEPTIISCKNQLWYAQSGYTTWRPTCAFTLESGEPGT